MSACHERGERESVKEGLSKEIGFEKVASIKGKKGSLWKEKLNEKREDRGKIDMKERKGERGK